MLCIIIYKQHGSKLRIPCLCIQCMYIQINIEGEIFMKQLSRAYYLTPVKIIRDLVHEYVNITKFELELIDTIEFQRLKDVRQLTCQQVFPSARHTRFEHSLGVLELTRQAIKHLNHNGIIGNSCIATDKPIISEQLQFNATLAALLHDIGHCPFSHLGEAEFNKNEVRKALCEAIEDCEQIEGSELHDIIADGNVKKVGAIHEQLSCIVILLCLKDRLSNLNEIAANQEDSCEISVDFELIIRSIIGLEYNVSSASLLEENKAKNAVIRLINSNVFDMDKLDYIMRDSLLTGIGTPQIDTKRLFRNMYFNDRYALVFTSKAVPPLQNMIDSRDGLYMYVYNHQTVVFSDFMNAYILRRLSHNARDFLLLANPGISEDELNEEMDVFQISSLGLVPKPYLFSIPAVVFQNRSDSDWISLLNVIHYCSVQYGYLENLETIRKTLRGELSQQLEVDQVVLDQIQNSESEELLVQSISRTFKLIHNYKNRIFLKPWWKTIFEFSNFMAQNFRDDKVREQLCQLICKGGKYGLSAAELRSQIAKHVIFITQNLNKKDFGILAALNEDEFFIIERPARFFDPTTIEKIDIALKASEISGTIVGSESNSSEYYIKSLTNIIPQKDYSSIYAKESFYIYSKPISDEIGGKAAREQHYKLIEKIFVFVATEFINRGEQDFVSRFESQETNSTIKKDSKQKMLKRFMEMSNVHIGEPAI